MSSGCGSVAKCLPGTYNALRIFSSRRWGEEEEEEDADKEEEKRKKKEKTREQHKHDQFSLEGGVCITDLWLCKWVQSCFIATMVLKMGVWLPQQLCYDAVGGEGTVENS